MENENINVPVTGNMPPTEPLSPLQPNKKNKRIWLGIGIVIFLALVVSLSAFFYFKTRTIGLIGSSGDKTMEKKDLFSGFSKLIISAANASDNFTLKPLNIDSLGVKADTVYAIKSKEPLDENIIKDNLRIKPDFPYDFKRISDTEWHLVPRQALPANTLVQIALTTAYVDENNQTQERDYSWVYQVKDSFKVLHSIPRDAGTNVPVNTGIEITFSHDNYYDYEKYFSINPSVKGKFEQHGRTLVFVPETTLNFRTLYQVTIKRGLPLADSAEILASDYIFTFETQSANNAGSNDWYGVYNRLIEANSQDAPIIQVSSYAAPNQLEVETFRFNDWQEYLKSIRERDNLPWWSYSKDDFLSATAKLKKVSAFTVPVKVSNQIKYIEFPEKMPSGFYLAELKNNGNKVQVWLQISDLSAYYNVTKTQTIFWVNDNIIKSPANGVKLELLDSQLSVLTDAQGVAVFKTPDEMLNNATNEKVAQRQYFKLTKDNNVLILPASQISHDWWWQSPAEADNYWLYLYTDRPRYQTTDTIKFWGLVKDRSSKTINEKATLTLFKEGYVDYYYQPVAIMSQELKISDLDTFKGELAIKNLRPDYYTLELKIGETVVKRSYITIMPYTKPAFQLSLVPDHHAAFAGDTVNLKVKASFFEGTPVPALSLKFETPEKTEKIFTTDENGEANLTYTTNYNDCPDDYGCWPKSTRLSISPENSELAEISAETYVNFYGPKVYLESKTIYPAKGQGQVEMTAKLIDLAKLEADESGNQSLGDIPAAGIKIEGDLIKTSYIKKETGTAYDFINKTSYKTYSYERREEKVRSFSGTTDQNGQYIFKQQLEPEISYQLKYRVIDSQGRFDNKTNYLYYYDGISLNHYDGFNYQYYHLSLTDPITQQIKTYSINDQVKAIFNKNDEPVQNGNNRFLYLQLANGLQEYQVASKNEYNFAFESRDVPNVNLVGVYFDGRSYHSTAESYWGESVNFKTADRELKVKVETDKNNYLPGENVKLNIAVTDINNKPLPAEVNLNLVDEAYYAVAEDTAAPLESIYSSVGMGTLIAFSTHESLKDVTGGAEKGCFAAGTDILLADGTNKPIEKMAVGDQVLTFSDPVSRQLIVGRVEEVVEHLVGEYMIINKKIKITPEHQVFSNNHFVDAGRLKAGDWLWSAAKEKIIVRDIEIKHELIKVYNLRIDPQHTYIADGIWVHNAEKGGGAREYFTDAAVFQSVRTGSDGRATTEFKLPDNITSWRVTAQGITQDLWAGVSVTKIPVSLPVFAEVTIGKEYLTADKPLARLRAYGTALTAADKVDFSLSAPTLGLDKSPILSASSFKSVYYNLPALSLGEHKIVYELKSAKGNDSIKLPLQVVSSRLAGQTSESSQLTTETKVKAINNFPMAVVLSDLGRNELYDPLLNLSWSWGDRLDQKYVRKLSRETLKKYYQEDIIEPDFNPFDYQLSSGGLTLLPYSSEDLEFSARVSALGAETFDKVSLAQYFFNKLENGQANHEEISYALFGLAELGEPVLTRINSWLKRTDLSPKEQLYLAQALADLGAKELSQTIFRGVLKQYGEEKLPQIVIRVSNNYDEVFQATAIAAVLAASLDVSEAKGLFKYLEENQVLYGQNKNSENLFSLEKLNYIQHILPNLKPSPAKVAYELAGETKEVNVTGSNLYSFQLAPEQAGSLNFKSVTGQVGISVRYLETLDLNKVKRDSDISIRREYYVNGAPTTQIKENDLVEVRLYPSFNKQALSGNYQITDILPSGLAPVTKLYYRGNNYECNYWYPYNTDGQMVKYFINRDWRSNYCGGDYIKYYARVKNRGVYLAEPAIIQSFVNPDFINYSNSQSITITE